MDHQEFKINELINKVKLELKKTLYSDSSIREFTKIWDSLTEYMVRIEKTIFTAKVGMDFLEEEYGITVYKKLSYKKNRCVRAINLLSDYLLHGMIFARMKQGTRTYHPQFQEIFQGYINRKMANNWSNKTLQSYEIYLGRFFNYLNSRGVSDIRDMNEDVVLGFVGTFSRYSPSIIHNSLCSLRTFFHYLYQEGFVTKNFAYIVPRDGYRQKTKVPSAYTKEEVEKLLESIDRGNPKGKRDYAIILIAARLGLRAQDRTDKMVPTTWGTIRCSL